MRTKIYIIIALLAWIALPVEVSSASLLQSSATFSVVGTIQPPTGTYFYTISISGSNYVMKNGTTGQTNYQSPNAAQVINAAIGNLTQDSKILIKTGTYILSGSITATKINNITLVFEEGAKLFVSNGMNAPAIRLNSVNNWLIQNPTIDGNNINQAHVPARAGDEFHGIIIRGGSNNQIDRANITNTGVSGVYFLSNSNEPSNNNGVTNSLITYSGWNGITVWSYGGTQYSVGNYAINNEVSHSGDVGIAVYGLSTRIENNNVHDMDGVLGDPKSSPWIIGPNTHWGIAVEGGGQSYITKNNVSNCNEGIHTTFTADSNTISNNTVNNAQFGIYITSNNNMVDANNISNIQNKAIIVTDSNNNTFSDNQLSGIIYVAASSDIRFIDNTVNAPNYYGVEISSSLRTIIESNTISGYRGINIANAQCLDTLIKYNDLSGIVNTKISDSGTGTIIIP